MNEDSITLRPVDRPPARSAKRREIGLHVGRLLLGEAANKTLRFAATVILARALSESDFGLVNVGIALSGILLVATSLGLPDVAAREVAVRPERAGWLVGRVGTVRVLIVTLVSVGGIGAGSLVWPGHTSLLILAAVMAGFMSASGDWLARGLGRMTLFAAANATAGATVLAGSLLVWGLSGSAAAGLSAMAAAELAAAIVFWVRLHRKVGVEIGVSGVRPMLRAARPLALSSLAVYSYYANVDTVILAATRSTREAGLYSAPYRLFLVLNLVSIFASFAMLPPLSRLAEAGADSEANDLVRSMILALASYGLLTLGLVELAGADILQLLFGKRFLVASGTFVLLVSGVAWYAVGYPAGYSLVASKQNGRFLWGAATASILCLGLDLALIPPLGMRGAGLATTIAFTAAAVVWLSSRGLIGRATIATLVALTISTLLAVITVFVNADSRIAGSVTLSMALLLITASRRWSRLAGAITVALRGRR